MLEVIYAHTFKRDLKKIRSEKDKADIRLILNKLINEEELPYWCHPHALIGSYIGCYECHIQPDLLLIYEIDGNILYLYRIGSHAALFK